MFKYLYHGDNIDLLTSGYVVTEFLVHGQYILIVQDENSNIIEIAHTDLRNNE